MKKRTKDRLMNKGEMDLLALFVRAMIAARKPAAKKKRSPRRKKL
jgi:hypothetical protein